MHYIDDGWGMGFGKWFIFILLIFVVLYFLREYTKSK